MAADGKYPSLSRTLSSIPRRKSISRKCAVHFSALTSSCSRRTRSPSGDDQTPPSSPHSFSERNSLSQRKPWRDGPQQDDPEDGLQPDDPIEVDSDQEDHDLSGAASASQQGEECLEGLLKCACGRSGTFGLDYCDDCYWQTLCWHITDPTFPRDVFVRASLEPSELKASTPITMPSAAPTPPSTTGRSLHPLEARLSSTSLTSASRTSSLAPPTLSGPSTLGEAKASSSSPSKSSTPSSQALPFSRHPSAFINNFSRTAFASHSSAAMSLSPLPASSPSRTKSSA